MSETAQFATIYDKKEGYLKTARGNAFGNVVKDGDKVIMHSATGVDFEVPILKQLAISNKWRSPDAEVAMSKVVEHNDSLECYACHASWVPQCYGCHVQVNYGKDKKGKPLQDTDWVASGNKRFPDGSTAESAVGSSGIKSPGKVFEKRSYLRWEEPVLGINGEGRVTPLMPGCQIVYTVIGRDGNTVALNQLGKSYDEQKELGQNRTPDAIDMAVEFAPDNADAYINRAQVYRHFGRFKDVFADLDKAIKLQPDSIPARFNRGSMHFSEGAYQKAMQDFEYCVAVDPHAPAPYFNRAATHDAMGKRDMAIADMEIRYAIRPLGRIEIDYDDPHGATPDPNHVFPLIFQVLTGKLSAGGRSPSREYNQEDVKAMFNADWAVAVVFDVEPDFTREYAGGLMLAMHKNQMADAYVIYLFNDYEAAKSRINENLTTLVFSKKVP